MAERDGVIMGASATQARERQLKTEGMAARILIVDDHEIVREGIRTLLRRIRPEWEVCGEAKNGKEAVEAAVALTPDILILDVTMPVMSGLEAASRIARHGPRLPHSHLHHARNEKSHQRSPRHRRSRLRREVASLPRPHRCHRPHPRRRHFLRPRSRNQRKPRQELIWRACARRPPCLCDSIIVQIFPEVSS